MVFLGALGEGNKLDEGSEDDDSVACVFILGDEAVGFHVVEEEAFEVVFVIDLSVDNVKVVFVHSVVSFGVVVSGRPCEYSIAHRGFIVKHKIQIWLRHFAQRFGYKNVINCNQIVIIGKCVGLVNYLVR